MSGLRKECKIAMKMSFSGKVKEELASQLSPARHCQIAEFNKDGVSGGNAD